MITLFIILALLALALLFVSAIAKTRNTNPAAPHRNKGFRRHWRKVYLLPIGIHRLTGWLPGARMHPRIQFANIGEGTYGHGKRSYLPDAATTSRYLLYKRGTDADHCAICGAADDPLGPSDDQAGSDGVPITINLLGAGHSTLRVVTDGTIADGDYVKCGATGKVTKASTTDLSFGRALISTDSSRADGDTITIIPMVPAKYVF
jgi:hypothetical protein